MIPNIQIACLEEYLTSLELLLDGIKVILYKIIMFNCNVSKLILFPNLGLIRSDKNTIFALN